MARFTCKALGVVSRNELGARAATALNSFFINWTHMIDSRKAGKLITVIVKLWAVQLTESV
jgi:hypothetical protein